MKRIAYYKVDGTKWTVKEINKLRLDAGFPILLKSSIEIKKFENYKYCYEHKEKKGRFFPWTLQMVEKKSEEFEIKILNNFSLEYIKIIINKI